MRSSAVRNLPSDRQGTLLLAGLGSRRDMALASDKLESAHLLAGLGLPVPVTRTIVQSGIDPKLDEPPWTEPGKLLIKPRHGSSAKGLFSVVRTADGGFLAKGSFPLSSQQLSSFLMQAARKDQLLVQSFLEPGEGTRDLSPDAPTVVRAFTARAMPGEPAKLITAMLKILPPGVDAPHGINELLLLPIELETGKLEDGILFSRPADRWARSPWNDISIRGRIVPEWDKLRDMVIRASAIMPATPLIGWDVLLGQQGPVILEANTGVSLFRAMLWHFEKQVDSPLPAMLENWCRAAGITQASGAGKNLP